MGFDVIVIGCGAAGLQAAIHAARKKVKVLVIGKPESSSLMKAHIENYFGVASTAGKELLDIGQKQAKEFGAELLGEEVIGLERKDGGFVVRTDGLKEFVSKTLIIAAGITRNKLNVEGEKEYHGLGVSYCANCDCHIFKKKTVAIVGDGSNAAAAALLLKDYATKVYWVNMEPKPSPELMRLVVERQIEILSGAWPSRIVGEQTVKAIELKDGRKLDVDGVFVELGAKGAADLAMEVDVLADEKGNIAVDQNCKTEVEGVYACGDITGQPWQLARSVGQGCIAGLSAAALVRKEAE
ncbi:MAG TPA: NAD(P)/FAD-dependent oxidoreductase [Methanomassiliicoccales archaeon]|nr:NAD(P)/FAD-dependent oxidoreductase [Methanomassiliicoccales archaeon]